jgi:NAD(P)-dependent dehydrogenase (short-subunit alcohol dehydrogenase family)
MLESARFGRQAMAERVVVVTGSSGGIGSAIAERFTAGGDHVVGLDLRDGVDVTRPGDCQAAVDRTIAEHGRIDVLCNNAGVGAVGDVVSSTPADWERVFAVNVFGVANMSRAVLPAMRAAGRGSVVNTCSVVASVGLVDRAVYSASKGAVLALTRAMAIDELPYGVRVNCVSPGTVSSPWVERTVAAQPDPGAALEALRKRQPLGRMVTCEEVAAAVAYLADDETFTTGADFLLDGGITGVRVVE